MYTNDINCNIPVPFVRLENMLNICYTTGVVLSLYYSYYEYHFHGPGGYLKLCFVPVTLGVNRIACHAQIYHIGANQKVGVVLELVLLLYC